jgi:hypothetical protein
MRSSSRAQAICHSSSRSGANPGTYPSDLSIAKFERVQNRARAVSNAQLGRNVIDYTRSHVATDSEAEDGPAPYSRSGSRAVL